LQAAGFGPVDYVEVRDAGDLSRMGPGPLPPGRKARILAAARLGRARLIDNMAV
jgi:pantoate--beta-alanine ligase